MAYLTVIVAYVDGQLRAGRQQPGEDLLAAVGGVVAGGLFVTTAARLMWSRRIRAASLASRWSVVVAMSL